MRGRFDGDTSRLCHPPEEDAGPWASADAPQLTRTYTRLDSAYWRREQDTTVFP